MIDVRDFKRFVETEWCGDRGQPIVWLPWWAEAAEGLRDSQQTAVVSPRQEGKSTFASAVSGYLLFHERDCFVQYIASSETQARSVLRAKLGKVIERNPRLARDARILEGRVMVDALNSELEVTVSATYSAVGRSPTLLVCDELRDWTDEAYWRALPSVAAGGKILIVSSPGAPIGVLYEITTRPGAGTRVVWIKEHSNPCVTDEHLRAVAEYAHLFEHLHAREYLAEFRDAGDAFVQRAQLEAVVDDSLEDLSTSTEPCFAFLDLSRRRDLSSLVAVTRSWPTEEKDVLTCALVRVWDPRSFDHGEMDFGVIRAALVELFERFDVITCGLDDRFEAAELVAWIRTQSWGGRVRQVSATSEDNMKMWAALKSRIVESTIRLPRHKRLLDELVSLKVEDIGQGWRWRVTDSSRRLHRDVSMSLAGAVWLASEHAQGGESRVVMGTVTNPLLVEEY